MTTGTASAGLSIRRGKVGDAAAMARHMNDPAVYGGTLQLPYASEEIWHRRLTDMGATSSSELLLVAERDSEFLGAAGLHPAGRNARRAHAMMLGISVSSAAQGQGVGTALMAALCEYADRWLGVLRIELTVYTDNAVAMRLYKKFGFEIEGTMKGYSLRDGAYVDVFAMARFHPRPPGMPAR